MKAIRTYALWGNNLKLHIEAVHEEKKRSNVIDEEKCLKFTHWRKYLVREGKKQFKCDFSNKEFSKKVELWNHINK